LVERGVRFVNVYHASWDHHSNLDAELTFNATMADQPIAALLKDLKQRGLLDTTLVVWGSEFGATPLGENRKGYQAVTAAIIIRSHSVCGWPAAESKAARSSVRRTKSVGTSSKTDSHQRFSRTILRLFGLEHTKLTLSFPRSRFSADRCRRQGCGKALA